MKKFILLLLVFFTITGISYAQENNSPPKEETTVYQDIKQAAPTLYQDVKGALKQLSEALAVGAEHVYGVLVKQQVVEAITWLIFNIFALLIVIFLWIMFARNDDKDRDEWWGLPFTFQLLQLVLLAFTLDNIMMGFYNPEYGAIKDILDVIK
jgi:hypothetical protein